MSLPEYINPQVIYDHMKGLSEKDAVSFLNDVITYYKSLTSLKIGSVVEGCELKDDESVYGLVMALAGAGKKALFEAQTDMQQSFIKANGSDNVIPFKSN